MDNLKNILSVSPALKLSAWFISGICIGSLVKFEPLLLLLMLILIFAYALIFSSKNYGEYTQFTSIILIVIITGTLKSNVDINSLPENSIRMFEDTKQQSFDLIRGIIEDIPDYDSNKIKFILDAKTMCRNKDTLHITGKISVNINLYTQQTQQTLSPGDEVILKGKLSSISSERNPGEFNYNRFLAFQDIHKMFYLKDSKHIRVVSGKNKGFIYDEIIFPAKKFACRVIEKNSLNDEAAYLKGLVTGDRSDISPEMKRSFVDAGVMHLIAVSGLNVGYIILFLSLLFSALRIPGIPRTVITILFLIFYCMFTGNSPSIVRATVMGIAVLVSLILERKINFFNSIGIASVAILSYDSRQIFDAGFILSFSAVFSMVVIYSVFEDSIMKKIISHNFKGKKISLWFAVIFFTTFAAQIGTLPLTASYFGKISLISLLANIFVIPVANLSLALGFLQITSAVFSDYASVIVSEVNNLLLMLQLSFIKWCSEVKFSYFYVPAFNYTYLIIFYFFLVLLLTIKSKIQLCKRILFILLIAAFIKIYKIEINKNLKVIFFDVGQGDCTLIITPDDKVILVDCGMISGNFNSGERTVFPYLMREGIKEIDLLIITHLHADHTGGLNFLLENIKVHKIIESGQQVKNHFYNITDSLISSKKTQKEIVRDGDFIDSMDNLRLYFLFPGRDFVNDNGTTKDGNINNGSVVFLLKYGSSEFLFTGDIEEEAEKFIALKYGSFIKSDLLKTSHHGSSTSTTIPFLALSRPEAAVISCGRFNKFNHPSKITVNRLHAAGADVYRTDIDDALVFESDGKTLELVKWK